VRHSSQVRRLRTRWRAGLLRLAVLFSFFASFWLQNGVLRLVVPFLLAVVHSEQFYPSTCILDFTRRLAWSDTAIRLLSLVLLVHRVYFLEQDCVAAVLA